MVCGGGLGYLPICLVLISVSTFAVSYIIAIYDKDVAVYFPYISDTGTKPPESCIFGQFLNIAAALSLCTIYVRYKLVESLTGHEDEHIRKMNKAGLALGLFSSLGLSMVANFQMAFVVCLDCISLIYFHTNLSGKDMLFIQETEVEPVHVTGAAFVLGLGVLYEFLQTFLTYQMYPEFNGQYIARVRLMLSIVSTISMLTAFAFGGISRYLTNTKDKLHWKPDEKGFTAHITSTISEWVTAILFLCFFFTYIRDFQKVKIEIKARMRVRHLDENPLEFSDESTPLLA